MAKPMVMANEFVQVQMSVHGEALQALGLDSKWLMKEAKILIRTRVIVTRVMGPTAIAETGDDINDGGGNNAVGPLVPVRSRSCACATTATSSSHLARLTLNLASK